MSNSLTMQEQWNESCFLGADSSYLEELYEEYLRDPQSVLPEWRARFDELPEAKTAEAFHSDYIAKYKQLAEQTRAKAAPVSESNLQWQVTKLIDAYRSYGHHRANLDPLGQDQRVDALQLDLRYHGLENISLSEQFDTGDFAGLPERASLGDIHKALLKTYCGSMGVEYMHITDAAELEWLHRRIETNLAKPSYSNEERIGILKRLTAAETLERYLGRRYVGQKRFSIEGAEALIPLIDVLVYEGARDHAIKDVTLGMAHRGRLNVLINNLGKSPENLFSEFEGKSNLDNTSGDVKYHMGYSSNIQVGKHGLHLSLAFNPSHLEIVGPVVTGSVRARQRRRKDKLNNQAVPVILHGDAAFAGQGVVMESFTMSQARGFRIGGSIHVVINNQVGFTTSNPLDARSTLYCTDVAKMVQCPIFHVNADDPEAVAFVAKLALDYRMQFHKDVVIDLVCYRRHGHNESDEPSATQPMMYKIIRSHPTVREIYAKQLIQAGVVTEAQTQSFVEDYIKQLDQGKPVIELSDERHYQYSASWEKYYGRDWKEKTDTSIAEEDIQPLADKMLTFPEGFKLQTQVAKIMNDREAMARGERPMDWGFAENLAYASLVKEGYPIRLCGQDAGRGTFAHRHATVHDQNTGESYTPLAHINDTSVIVIDSVLSEEGVLAFEYGFATTEPGNLAIWEAQFGDFANGAQVVIDQFIASGEQKWGRLCGLVLLLPHGYEGMGPEHSSARLERYLQLCAQENMQVCMPTTPSQIFHLLRRQMIRPYRKPLIVMSPKSLLRHKMAVSTLSDLTDGGFQLVIPDLEARGKKVKRVVLCSGKVYYDLLDARKDKSIALIRIEQLYPFPFDALKDELSSYSHVKDYIWCQEEPKNQGSWYSIRDHLEACLPEKSTLSYAGRSASASPATGIPAVHRNELSALLNEALTL